MIVKGVVKLVERKGKQWTSKQGKDMFPFEYTFEDRVVLKANHTTEKSPFNIGDEVEYEIKKSSEEYGNEGRVLKPGGSDFKPGGNRGNSWYGSEKHLAIEKFRQKVIVAQSSLGYALEFHKQRELTATEDDVKKTADEFYEYAMNKAK